MINYKLAKFLCRFRKRGYGFVYEVDGVGGVSIFYIRKMRLFFDLGRFYTKNWLVKGATGQRIK